MSDSVRVRFAPSPTGLPHVGNIRTALFNWLFARHSGGSFIVRIEDTDVNRKVEGALEAILDGLRWLGIDWDEGPESGGDYGPYFQSQRLELYQAAIRQLLEADIVYPCYCSPERLAEMRAEQSRRKQPPGYDRLCRDLSQAERDKHESQGITPVFRFKIPLKGKTRFNDLIKGEVVFDNTTLDDFVLLKSDGYPTYHLANIVDDHLMKISHVLRADEWLSSTPKHMLLYEALGYKPPLFAHLPMILGSDRSKLSKRHGSTSIIDYREQGYLPQAMMNFLALLGWALDDHTEIFSREELIKHFSIERISKTGAIFSVEKLDWMNGVYIRDMSVDQITDYLVSAFDKGLPDNVARPLSRDYVLKMAPLIQERLTTLGETSDLYDFFFLDDIEYGTDILVGKKLNMDSARETLITALDRLQSVTFTSEILESVLRALASEFEMKTGVLFGLLRVATTGRTAAPPLFQTMEVLGKDRCLYRIDQAINKLGR